MLVQAPDLTEGMIEIAYQRKWLETTFSAIKFAQCIVQGLWYSDHPLMQLPHISQRDVNLISKEATNQDMCLWEYIRLPDCDKKGLELLSFEQRGDVLKACQILPCMKVDTKLFVEEPEHLEDQIIDENADKIFEQDLVTLRVVMTRQNTLEHQDVPPVYAPHFPKTLREAWWLILADKLKIVNKKSNTEAGIHCVEKVSETSSQIVHELRFMAPPRAGVYEMDLHVYSDCYMGLDQTIGIAFTVHPAVDLPEYIPHPEDVELDNEPTLFEQVMAANIDDSSDDEDEIRKVGERDDIEDDGEQN